MKERTTRRNEDRRIKEKKCRKWIKGNLSLPIQIETQYLPVASQSTPYFHRKALCYGYRSTLSKTQVSWSVMQYDLSNL
jgi:hypothetical protein